MKNSYKHEFDKVDDDVFVEIFLFLFIIQIILKDSHLNFNIYRLYIVYMSIIKFLLIHGAAPVELFPDVVFSFLVKLCIQNIIICSALEVKTPQLLFMIYL